jgi:hypothetical protein
VKTTGLFALFSLLLTIAFNQVAGMPREEARGPDQPIAAPAQAVMVSGGPLPALISEYVFLHQTRYESVPVHAMAGVKSCPE